jgi:hypothetical protein
MNAHTSRVAMTYVVALGASHIKRMYEHNAHKGKLFYPKRHFKIRFGLFFYKKMKIAGKTKKYEFLSYICP